RPTTLAIDPPLAPSPSDRLLRLAAYAVVATYAAVLAMQGPANVFGDDAAITFRYAERLAAGHGFTYNDHERVQGASNPLYTLALAAIVAVGPHVEPSARALAVVLLAASAVLTAILAREFSGSNFGLVAGVLLPTSFFFKYQALSGMESALAVCLGLLVVF